MLTVGITISLSAIWLSRDLALIMMDIDHFKAYNDHFGHQGGDECLKAVANTISSVAKRPGDLTARYGGEEFSVILSGTSADDAGKIAEKIRTRILALDSPHPESSTAAVVTLSLGVASLVPEKDSPPSVLIEKADKALYKAKNSGRNMVVVA